MPDRPSILGIAAIDAQKTAAARQTQDEIRAKYAQVVRVLVSDAAKAAARPPNIAVSMATATPTLTSAVAIQPNVRSRSHFACSIRLGKSVISDGLDVTRVTT